MKRKKVYVCAPFHGVSPEDRHRNEIKTGRRCRELYENGLHPVAPQLLYPRWLDEDDPKERADGLSAALEWLEQCDVMYVYGEIVTEGMEKEIVFAKTHGIPIVRIPEHIDEGA